MKYNRYDNHASPKNYMYHNTLNQKKYDDYNDNYNDNSNDKKDQLNKKYQNKIWSENFKSCLQIAFNILKDDCLDAINNLSRDSVDSNDSSVILTKYSNFLNKKDSIKIGDNKFPPHILHYGHLSKLDKKVINSEKININDQQIIIKKEKILRSGHHQNRTFKKFEDDYFHQLQVELEKKGYYLLDISNPKISKKVVIKLYRGKPKGYGTSQWEELWHGMNMIPGHTRENEQINIEQINNK